VCVLFPEACVVTVPSVEAAIAWLAEASHGATEHGRPLLVGGLETDLDNHLARWRGREVPLTELQLKLLACLAAEPGRARTFAELYGAAWDGRFLGHRQPVQAAVKRLRKKLAHEAPAVRIEAVRGVGFRLVVDRSSRAVRHSDA
jgi:DNA-binding response OmpR family regulator